eukprot:SAG31_NODE_1591_length_7814_cov_4.501453_10_plen_80_part_00
MSCTDQGSVAQSTVQPDTASIIDQRDGDNTNECHKKPLENWNKISGKLTFFFVIALSVRQKSPASKAAQSTAANTSRGR